MCDRDLTCPDRVRSRRVPHLSRPEKEEYGVLRQRVEVLSVVDLRAVRLEHHAHRLHLAQAQLFAALAVELVVRRHHLQSEQERRGQVATKRLLRAVVGSSTYVRTYTSNKVAHSALASSFFRELIEAPFCDN